MDGYRDFANFYDAVTAGSDYETWTADALALAAGYGLRQRALRHPPDPAPLPAPPDPRLLGEAGLDTRHLKLLYAARLAKGGDPE
jgi:hypothetical protein